MTLAWEQLSQLSDACRAGVVVVDPLSGLWFS
jgi:hypothetical protein